jgi:hypothetical protein
MAKTAGGVGVNGHGGKRKGAGRPRKWSFDDVLRIGQACEAQWRKAQKNAYDASHDVLFRERTDLSTVWKQAKQVPIQDRGVWRNSEAGQQHSADVDEELESLQTYGAEKPSAAIAGDGDGHDTVIGAAEVPTRLVEISNKPRRGTRTKIIADVAAKTGLPPSQVDNLWQAYRRFEAEE